MMTEYKISEMNEWIETLKAGDHILISGTIYTARDAVHKKWKELLKNSQKLPISLENTGIYYAGSAATPPNCAIGSCGPTTSSRMDSYYFDLANEGLRLTIGKGPRSESVKTIIQNTKGIYLCAVGGAGALYASCIKESKVLYYEELGCEALRKIEILRFPVFVGIDAKGNSIFSN